jgi:hypothetical protein
VNINLMYKRIRNLCGFLGMILPWVALLSGFLVKLSGNNITNDWWYSISATYYISPALAAILVSASLVLMTYDGYSKIDDLITTFSGVFGLLIVLFPCNCSYVSAFIESKKVGFFQLPVNITNTVHCASACVFFVLLGINDIFLFTKTDDLLSMSDNKKKRNKIYVFCGIGMFIGMIVMLLANIFNFPGYWTMIVEIIELTFFGISWLTKGGVILSDK